MFSPPAMLPLQDRESGRKQTGQGAQWLGKTIQTARICELPLFHARTFYYIRPRGAEVGGPVCVYCARRSDRNVCTVIAELKLSEVARNVRARFENTSIFCCHQTKAKGHDLAGSQR